MNMTPNCVANAMIYSPVPKESQWKVPLLKELISLRDGELYMEDDKNGQEFSREEIQNLIAFISTQ